MRRIVHVFLLASALAWPLSTFAYVNQTSVSSSDSGGMVAGSGQTVVTGDSSASASVVTDISGGSADVTITTEKDGHTSTEHQHIDVPNDQAIRIEVATSTGNAAIDIPKAQQPSARAQNAASVSVSIDSQLPTMTRHDSAHAEIAATSSTENTTDVMPASLSAMETLSRVFQTTVHLIGHFMSFFWS